MRGPETLERYVRVFAGRSTLSMTATACCLGGRWLEVLYCGCRSYGTHADSACLHGGFVDWAKGCRDYVVNHVILQARDPDSALAHPK